MAHDVAIEALCCATYVEDYLDCLESLPDQLQRHFSEIRRLDGDYYGNLNEVNSICQLLASNKNTNISKLLNELECLLQAGQSIGDAKLEQFTFIQELIEKNSRMLDQDSKNLKVDLLGGNEKVPETSILPCCASEAEDTVGKTEHQSDSSELLENDRLSVPSKRPRRQRMYGAEYDCENALDSSIGLLNSSQNKILSVSATVTPSSSTRKTERMVGSDKKPVNNGGSLVSSPASVKDVTSQLRTSGERDVDTSNHSSVGSSKKDARVTKLNNRKRKELLKSTKSNILPPDIPIDPDEPTYCLCEQVSYGEMIGCDNPKCELEWFHFTCVGLSVKPKGKWFCPRCRGDRSTVMKPNFVK